MNSPIDPTPTGDEASLRARLAELERQFKDQSERLAATAREYEAFSYSISHDLRAPLRNIAGFTRSLIEDHAGKLDAEGRRALHIVRDEARRMNELIDGTLAFSRVGRQRLDASDIDMTELARSAFQNLTEIMAPPMPAFEVKPLPRARGDRTMIRQVFDHLLRNAVKFSSRQPAARIEVTGWTLEGMNVFCVADNGVGFDPRYAHKLFGLFQRLHSQEDFEGAGTGLAIVQRIVQRHGGQTWAEGQAGAGAKFFFTLPWDVRIHP